MNRILARLIGIWPGLGKRLIDSHEAVLNTDIPWADVTKPMKELKIALLTTAGVHHKGQPPFDMKDKNGDPSFRIIDS